MRSGNATQAMPISDLVLAEINPAISRKMVKVLAGIKVLPGMVLAKIIAGAAAAVAKVGNTGNGVLTLDAASPILHRAVPGIYTLVCIAALANAGTFRVYAPNGAVLGDVTVGGAAFANQVHFTIADGAIDFVVGDTFEITVAEGSGKYQQLDPAGVGGAEVAAAIGYEEVDATLAEAQGIVLAHGVVVDVAGLIWPAGITPAQQAAALNVLEARGIATRVAL